MLLSTLMAGVTPNPEYAGGATNDEYILAIDPNPSALTPTPKDAYAVAGIFLEGVDAQLNPSMTEKTYIRMGATSTKTGNQRTFKITGDRYIGDAAQDYMLSHAVKFGIGKTVITNYVFFNMVTGIGEAGQVAIIVNSDGGGNSGENSAIDIELKSCGGTPSEYTYEPTGIAALALSSIVPADGAADVSKTASVVLTFNNAIASNNVVLIDTTTGDIVAVAASFDAAKKVLTLTPSSALGATTKYVVAIAGVVDVYGQTLAATSKDFTTVA